MMENVEITPAGFVLQILFPFNIFQPTLDYSLFPHLLLFTQLTQIPNTSPSNYDFFKTLFKLSSSLSIQIAQPI